jgi:hypothetical protein
MARSSVESLLTWLSLKSKLTSALQGMLSPPLKLLWSWLDIEDLAELGFQLGVQIIDLLGIVVEIVGQGPWTTWFLL